MRDPAYIKYLERLVMRLLDGRDDFDVYNVRQCVRGHQANRELNLSQPQRMRRSAGTRKNTARTPTSLPTSSRFGSSLASTTPGPLRVSNMGMQEKSEVVVICDHWPTPMGACRTMAVEPVEVGTCGHNWYRARDALRKRGWTIRDDRAICPACTKKLRDEGKNPDDHAMGF